MAEKQIKLTEEEQRIILPWIAELAGIQQGLQMAQMALLKRLAEGRESPTKQDESNG